MVVVGIVAGVVGVLVGRIAGFFRGGRDTALMRFTDLVITCPMIVIGAVLGKLAGGSSAVVFARLARASSCGPRWPGWCAVSS